mgnify:CR=1 FL=1
MKKYPRGNPSHCIQSIQKLSGYNLNESEKYCQKCDLLLNSEQDLELHKKNMLTKESGNISLEKVQNSNDVDNEKRAQNLMSALEPVPEETTQSQDKKLSKTKEIDCEYCPKSFTEHKNLIQHISVVHRNVRPFSCEICKKAFASKQEMIRHTEAEKGCSTRKFDQLPDSQGAMTHLTIKPVLSKLAENPILEPAVIPIHIPKIQLNENRPHANISPLLFKLVQ